MHVCGVAEMKGDFFFNFGGELGESPQMMSKLNM